MSSVSCSPAGRTPTGPRSRASRPMRSCAISGREARRPSTGPPHSAPRRRFNSFSTRGPSSTLGTRTAIRRSHGRAGTCARPRSSENSASAALLSTRGLSDGKCLELQSERGRGRILRITKPMQVLDVGGTVFQLRFLPDNRRLVIGTHDQTRNVTFEVLTLPGSGRVRLPIAASNLDSWWYYSHYGNAIAVHPTGEACYIGWDGRLYAFRTADGKSLPVPKEVKAHQVVLSPTGDRLLAAYLTHSERHLYAATTGPKGGRVVWRQSVPDVFAQVAGFLPDGEQFVTVDGAIRIRAFDTGNELQAGRVKPVGSQHPQISPDGRHLGTVGYHAMYFWDLTTLGKPRRISGTSSFGDFRSF